VTPPHHQQKVAVQIPSGKSTLAGDLSIPEELRGVVLFAHGSGSSRHSPRNQYVAGVLQDAGIATLLLDLLTEGEESADRKTAELRFDIGLLAGRLLDATSWFQQQPRFEDMKLGYFGASTGAAAALIAASHKVENIGAIVSRGGRPDLAGSALAKVQVPTLLIVGGNDPTVVKLNREALSQLSCEKRLEIVRGATHLFEEPGTLEEVARLARQWFEWHFGPSSRQSPGRISAKSEGIIMPNKSTIEAAREDLREGKSPSTAAGEFVREEIEHVRHGKHGARSPQQAIAIGLSKARRAGVPLKPPAPGKTTEVTRRRSELDYEKGEHNPQTREEGSTKRGRARVAALKREPKSTASHRALSRHAKSAARRRGQTVHKKAA
jgi:dienelactone hydrolase